MDNLNIIPLTKLYRELWKRRDFSFITESPNGIHKKQQQALQYLTDDNSIEILYGGAAGGAKSWTGCTWLLFMCDQYPGTRWFIGRDELKRLRESTLMTFFKTSKQYGFKRDVDFKYNGQDHFIEFSNGSRIDLLELKYLPSDPLFERLGSVEYTGGFIDEAGETHFGAFDTLKSRIGRQMNDLYKIIGKIFLSCNPKKNWLYNYFFELSRRKLLPEGRRYIPSLIQDNPFRESGYEDKLLSITDKSRKERLYLGNWDYDDDPAVLMDYDSISSCFTNEFVKAGTKYITADIARFGDDKTIIILWSGLRAEKIISLSKSSTSATADEIAKMQLQNSVPRSQTIVDDDGIGGGVVDQNKCIGFVNGSSPLNPKPQEQYANLRAQCYFKLAEMVTGGQLFIRSTVEDREMIVAELGAIKRKDPDSDTKKISIISREDIKKLIGRSPDYASALMMRMYFEVKPRSMAPSIRVINR